MGSFHSSPESDGCGAGRQQYNQNMVGHLHIEIEELNQRLLRREEQNQEFIWAIEKYEEDTFRLRDENSALLEILKKRDTLYTQIKRQNEIMKKIVKEAIASG